MIEYINSFFKSLNSDAVTEIFLVVTLATAASAIFRILKREKSSFARYAPTLLTTIGIFGTFVGITVGLLQFDPSSMETIDRSMPAFLGGLKLAFFTSIFGMGASMAVKFVTLFKGRVDEIPTDVAQDPIEILKAQYEAIRELRSAIAGDGDSTVVTQLQKVRTDIADGLASVRRQIGADGSRPLAENVDGLVAEVRGLGTQIFRDFSQMNSQQAQLVTNAEAILQNVQATRAEISGEHERALSNQLLRISRLIDEGQGATHQKLAEIRDDARTNADELKTELRNFAEKVSELGSRALIEALSSVIQDFNKKLTEQFGDNFRRLDESVGKLVVWQDNYKQQMVDMRSALETAVASVIQSEKALGAVALHASSIPGLIDQLRPVVETAQHQLTQLEKHLEAFAELRDRAIKAVPEIRQVIDDSFAEMKSAVFSARDHYQSLLSGSKEFIDKFMQESAENQTQFMQTSEEWLELVTDTLKDGAVVMERSSKESAAAVQSAVKEIVAGAEGVRKDLEKSAKGHQGAMEAVMADVGRAMQQAHEKVEAHLTKLHGEQRAFVQQVGDDLRKHNEKAAADRTELINKEISELDRAIASELQRVMQQMGNALGSITEKFTTDYKSLTEQMQTVVASSRQVRGDGRGPDSQPRRG